MLLALFLMWLIHPHIVVMYLLLFVVRIWLLNYCLIVLVVLFLIRFWLFVYQVLLVVVYFHEVAVLMFQSRIPIHMLLYLFGLVALCPLLKTWILIVVSFGRWIVQYHDASLIGLLFVKKPLPYQHELL